MPPSRFKVRLQSPMYVRQMAQGGMVVPTYSYAANNPLRYVDVDGLRVTVAANASQGLRDAVSRLRSNEAAAHSHERSKRAVRFSSSRGSVTVFAPFAPANSNR